MTESQWLQCDDFYRLLGSTRGIPDSSYCRIGLALIELLPTPLTDLETEAIELIKEMEAGKGNPERAIELQKQLRETLSNDQTSQPASVISWVIEPLHVGSYSGWHATALAACNVVEMKLATNVQVCDIVRGIVRYSETKNVDHGMDRAALRERLSVLIGQLLDSAIGRGTDQGIEIYRYALTNLSDVDNDKAVPVFLVQLASIEKFGHLTDRERRVIAEIHAITSQPG